jgi:hypothetical protein
LTRAGAKGGVPGPYPGNCECHGDRYVVYNWPVSLRWLKETHVHVYIR